MTHIAYPTSARSTHLVSFPYVLPTPEGHEEFQVTVEIVSPEEMYVLYISQPSRLADNSEFSDKQHAELIDEATAIAESYRIFKS